MKMKLMQVFAKTSTALRHQNALSTDHVCMVAHGRQHICMFCTDQKCKDYFHVHGHTFQSPNLPKKNAEILIKLSQALEKHAWK